ncbi:putative oxidoreductase [Vibrio halioticoli NBRC 102217]|uniref:Putative oxidoreductase n=1 Tax=Vibrio halioticoli NBRC 102217 TaxID=1219072 RepID=V5FL68_9VIBR|nr:SDR family NAD(P)-dependent oxidoreductase [Vibrio halioticoli]GAD89637.1 putative oxidoreductase [Vibrio halioticoli NBRC 102217]
MNILIIGASGGIGTAIIKQAQRAFPTANLYATYRSSKPQIQIEAPLNNIIWFKVDASLDEDIKHLSEEIEHLDILINAVGFLHAPGQRPEKSISEFTVEQFNRNLTSNTLPTLLLGKHFSTHLKGKKNTYFVALSARIGSIEDNHIGGWISYRCSKAALNMAIKTISIEWQVKLPNCCVFAFHPGTTDTSLSQPFQKNVPQDKLFTTDYVSQQLFKLINTVQAKDTGKFYSFTGDEIPW